MTVDITEETMTNKVKVINNGWSSLYGLAFVGAVVYYVQNATSFWVGVWGVIKAIFWPGVLMYKLLEYLKL